MKQLRRLEQMHSDSSEASVVRTYLDTIVELPWNKFSKEVLDIARARDVLDKNHFGLDKVKERILEYLSVRKLNPRKKDRSSVLSDPRAWARPLWARPLPRP